MLKSSYSRLAGRLRIHFLITHSFINCRATDLMRKIAGFVSKSDGAIDEKLLLYTKWSGIEIQLLAIDCGKAVARGGLTADRPRIHSSNQISVSLVTRCNTW